MMGDSARFGWHRSIRLVALGLLLCALVAVVACGRSQSAAGPDRLNLVLSPHPDDEMEAWSLIEDGSDVYHVFVYATLGEETSFCAPGLPGYEAETGERPPRPMPGGTHSKSCEDERINSTLQFLNQMAETDSGLPHALDESELQVSEPFPERGVRLLRDDDGTVLPADRRARIYDGGDQGLVMFWDMGDGDLTRDEVAWVVGTVLTNRAALGIPDLPWDRLVGASFFHADAYAECMIYTHPDHEAVHDALWNSRFPEFSEQVAPTCRDDPRASLTGVVGHFEDAMRLGGPALDGFRVRLGAHNIHYGWLKAPYFAGDWVGQGEDDGELVHRNQFFWVRSS